MLDGQRYFAEFPDEEQPPCVLTSGLLSTLAAIEREISAFITRGSQAPGGLAADAGEPER